MYFVYILRSLKDGKKYVGCSTHPAKRLNEHNNGKCKATKNRIPFELIYSEPIADKTSAFSREKYLKTGKGRQYIKEVLNLEILALII